ncbi:hypothetical protein CC86DRAFT_383355 [Ophiobolus disseminans]|uniref:Beta/gamma crystallin 'Greek key' domain-containing protein n=1 Tax=Ophiobolus disseminans TaxID=1469910 RepID=A0A6A6ZWT0_9PLEO|nr:hypothetical protein CC86DRAFT_383355 [Ophiobolus disseminans]
MRFTAPIAAIILGATAFPSNAIARDETGPANIPAPVQTTVEHAPVVDGAEPFVVDAAPSLAKRGTLIVEVWQGFFRGERHESLSTQTQTCYNLGNGWSDVISSLSVPNGFGCDFYENGNCGKNGGKQLNVGGGGYVDRLDKYAMNDAITSYRCYN